MWNAHIPLNIFTHKYRPSLSLSRHRVKRECVNQFPGKNLIKIHSNIYFKSHAEHFFHPKKNLYFSLFSMNFAVKRNDRYLPGHIEAVVDDDADDSFVSDVKAMV